MRAYKRDNNHVDVNEAHQEYWSYYDYEPWYEWYNDNDYYSRQQDPDYSTIRVEIPSYMIINIYRGGKNARYHKGYISMVDMESFYSDKRKRHLRIAKVLGENIDSRNLLGNYFNI